MPIYEYECVKGHRFEMLRPMDQRNEPVHCNECRGLARKVMSKPAWWQMGWNFLKAKSENSPAAPTGSGYYPEWDQAYGP